MNKATVIIIMLLYFTTSAETSLSGNVGGMVLDSTGNPYIITNDLVVDKGKSITLKPGCILLFKPFTGLIVEGRLIVEGTKEKPVVLTTTNNSNYYNSTKAEPQAFDWNGVFISKTATDVHFANFILSYSVFGLKFQTEKYTVVNGVFHMNGQYNMTVNGIIKPVADDIPYSCSGKPNVSAVGSNKMPLILGTTGTLCGLGTIVSTIVYFNTSNKYRKETNPIEQIKDRSSITNSFISALIFGTATAILVPSAIIIYNSQNADNKKTVLEIIPQNSLGLSVCMHF